MEQENRRLRNELTKAKNNAKFGWGKYFRQCRQNHLLAMTLNDIITGQGANNDNTDNVNYLVRQLEDLIKEHDIQIECPVCMETIDIREDTFNLKITQCGHKYCKTCYEHLEKCAICRKDIRRNR